MQVDRRCIWHWNCFTLKRCLRPVAKTAKRALPRCVCIFVRSRLDIYRRASWHYMHLFGQTYSQCIRFVSTKVLRDHAQWRQYAGGDCRISAFKVFSCDTSCRAWTSKRQGREIFLLKIAWSNCTLFSHWALRMHQWCSCARSFSRSSLGYIVRVCAVFSICQIQNRCIWGKVFMVVERGSVRICVYMVHAVHRYCTPLFIDIQYWRWWLQ